LTSIIRVQIFFGDRGVLDQTHNLLAHGIAGLWIVAVVWQLQRVGDLQPLLSLPMELEGMVRLLGIDARWGLAGGTLR
jgi:hypothetical protein